MKRTVFSIIGIIFLSFGGFSQLSENAKKRTNMTSLSQQTGILRPIPPAPGGYEGSFFVIDEFNKSIVYWTNYKDSAETAEGNFHLELGKFVIQEKGKIKSISDELIKDFVLYTPEGNRRFISTNEISESTFDRDNWYLEEKLVGDISLYKYWFLEILKPTYNRALDAGNKNTILSKKLQYVLVRDGEYIMNFKLKKKIIQEEFPERASELVKYVKSEKLSDDDAGMMKFVSYLNK